MERRVAGFASVELSSNGWARVGKRRGSPALEVLCAN
jgi:hypothetical protein